MIIKIIIFIFTIILSVVLCLDLTRSNVNDGQLFKGNDFLTSSDHITKNVINKNNLIKRNLIDSYNTAENLLASEEENDPTDYVDYLRKRGNVFHNAAETAAEVASEGVNCANKVGSNAVDSAGAVNTAATKSASKMIDGAKNTASLMKRNEMIHGGKATAFGLASSVTRNVGLMKRDVNGRPSLVKRCKISDKLGSSESESDSSESGELGSSRSKSDSSESEKLCSCDSESDSSESGELGSSGSESDSSRKEELGASGSKCDLSESGELGSSGSKSDISESGELGTSRSKSDISESGKLDSSESKSDSSESEELCSCESELGSSKTEEKDGSSISASVHDSSNNEVDESVNENGESTSSLSDCGCVPNGESV